MDSDDQDGTRGGRGRSGGGDASSAPAQPTEAADAEPEPEPEPDEGPATDDQRAARERDLAALFEAARGGDAEALNRLLARLRPQILAQARRRVGDGTREIGPESLTQESLQRLVKAIARARNSGNATLRTLVNRVLHSAHIDAVRRAQADKRGAGEAPVADAAELLRDPRPTPDEQLEQTRQVRRALIEVARLPERQRRALQAVLEERPVAEVAAELGVREEAVFSLLYRARQQLARRTVEDPTPEVARALAQGLRDGEAAALPEEVREFLRWLDALRRAWFEEDE